VPRDWEAPADGWVKRALADIARQDWTLLVLHDGGDTGAMDHLPLFLDAAMKEAECVREFPAACLPMIEGRGQPGLKEIVTAAADNRIA
jgi:hypothetical protein